MLAVKLVNVADAPYVPITPAVILAYSYVFEISTLPPEAETVNEPVPVEHVGLVDELNVTATAVTLLLFTLNDVVHEVFTISLK